jgi:hypothetical protein
VALLRQETTRVKHAINLYPVNLQHMMLNVRQSPKLNRISTQHLAHTQTLARML